ncbi:MAG TPA: RuvX/YqgF family protein, partial [Candidatus Baltobacteraceae bacterium]
ASERMDAFCVALGRVFFGAIERVDERLTTAQVNRTLIDADVSRAKRKRVVDQLAAAVILDGYLARRRNGRIT